MLLFMKTTADFFKIFGQNSWFKQFTNSFLSLNVKPMRLLLTFLSIFFSKNWSKCKEKLQRLRKKQRRANVHKTINLHNSSKRAKFRKILFWNSTIDKLSNDITHSPVRWKYRSAKIDGTKKTSWRYSSSPH